MTTQNVTQILFGLLAFLSLFFAVATVRTHLILRSAFYLMAVLVMSAGFYLMLDAEFVAGIQILVYVGGVVILIVYAVMLTRSSELIEEAPSLSRRFVALFVSGSFFAAVSSVLLTHDFHAVMTPAAPTGAVEKIGLALLDYGPQGYVLPFEVISILLLAVVIGALVIARKTKEVSK